MFVRRFTAAAAVVCLGFGLGSCTQSPGQFSGYVSDHWRHWAGGMPDDVPPRPGAPGYNEFIAHGGANEAAASPASGSAVTSAPEFVATGSTVTSGKTAAAAKASAHPKTGVQPKTIVQPASAPQVESPEDQPAQDSSVVKGGLY
jgi:hypothetical protein